ncbi:hypothetical protein SGLAM104S_05403 [Streptomyces glaucescens]
MYGADAQARARVRRAADVLRGQLARPGGYHRARAAGIAGAPDGRPTRRLPGGGPGRVSRAVRQGVGHPARRRGRPGPSRRPLPATPRCCKGVAGAAARPRRTGPRAGRPPQTGSRRRGNWPAGQTRAPPRSSSTPARPRPGKLLSRPAAGWPPDTGRRPAGRPCRMPARSSGPPTCTSGPTRHSVRLLPPPRSARSCLPLAWTRPTVEPSRLPPGCGSGPGRRSCPPRCWPASPHRWPRRAGFSRARPDQRTAARPHSRHHTAVTLEDLRDLAAAVGRSRSPPPSQTPRD